MQFTVLLLLILTGSSTAYSQITGLKRGQKVEIVSTLESYDAVLIEIDLTEQLLGQCNEMNDLLRKQLSVTEELNKNLKAQINTYEEQNDVQKKQLKSVKRKAKIGLAIGIGIGILGLII